MFILMAMLFGVLIGLLLPADFSPPMAYATYLSVGFLAGMDSLVGAIRAGMEGKFRLGLFVSGFLVNVLLAALITWIGDRLGVDLYMAAIVTFGVRLFNNLGYIRRDIVLDYYGVDSSLPPHAAKVSAASSYAYEQDEAIEQLKDN